MDVPDVSANGQAERRAEDDAEYVATFARCVADLFPGCPIEEQRAIAMAEQRAAAAV
jgi:hypothetical protein